MSLNELSIMKLRLINFLTFSLKKMLILLPGSASVNKKSFSHFFSFLVCFLAAHLPAVFVAVGFLEVHSSAAANVIERKKIANNNFRLPWHSFSIKTVKSTMNNFLRSIIAGYAGWKWGGGCLGGIIVFFIVFWLLGYVNC